MPDDEGRPIPVPVREERLRHMLAKLADWRKQTAKGDLVPAPPPTGVVKSMVATPDPALPVLAGIVTAPVLGRGGVLLTEPGYHPDARLLYRPPPGFVLPPVPERPSTADIAAATSLLLDDLLGDFPFTSEAERAHALCLLLLGFVRAMVDGPTPLHLIEKPTPGTGATLMVDVIATIHTGCGASVMTEGRDDEEWRKRITAKLRQIPSLVLIDNLRAELDSAALAAALTAPFWEDRILGASEMARLPIRCAWVATGNNPTSSHEIARRLVRIRLDARTDQPWRRDGFRHPDLMVWVRANRAGLVAACLTLCRAWTAAGRPRGEQSIGSYEAWSATMGGILGVAGVPGFLGNLEELMEGLDAEGGAWRAFIGMWWDRFGTAEVSVSDLLGFAQSTEAALPISAKSDHALKVALGLAFRRLRDRSFRIGELLVHLRVGRVLHNSQRWKLERGSDSAGAHSTGSADGGLGAAVGDSEAESPTAEHAVPSRGVLGLAVSVSGAMTVLVQAARSIVLSDGGWPRLCQPSTLRMVIWPEASSAQNSIAAVSALGSTVCVLMRRLNSSCRRSIALVVRADFHWLGGKRVKLNSRSPASSRLSATARHFSRHLRRKARRRCSISFGVAA